MTSRKIIIKLSINDIIEELLFMIDIHEETLEQEDFDPKYRKYIDSLKSATDKKLINLNDSEIIALNEEFNEWLSKDDWSYKYARKYWKLLITIMARLGMLEEFNENSYYSRKPKTIIVDGTKYIV